jgi:hypothetical protein
LKQTDIPRDPNPSGFDSCRFLQALTTEQDSIAPFDDQFG